MVAPDPTRTYETFLPLRLPLWLERSYAWSVYQRRLREAVLPVVRGLQAGGVIDWFGFLVHDFHSGVPTGPGDPEWYLHLRVSLAPGAGPEDLQARLPVEWRWTRPMALPRPPSLDRVDLAGLVDGDAGHGWRLLGDFSEWSLRFVEAHTPDRDIPAQNVAQLMHYLDNMLLLDLIRPASPSRERPARRKVAEPQANRRQKAEKKAKKKMRSRKK